VLPEDVPAAHSMDSAWFAVDACGHVATAETGEAGALPGPFRPQELDETALRDAIARVVPPGEVVVDLRAQAVGEAVAAHRLWGAGPQDALVFADRPEDLAPLVVRHGGQLVPAKGGAAAVLPAVQPAALDELHAAGRCRACSWLWDPLDQTRRAARLGLYEYEHLTENWIAGPYGVIHPRHPIKLHQLPPEVVALAEWVRFEGLCFGETPLLQPADHVPCATWSAPYLSADGRTVRTQRPDGLDPEELASIGPPGQRLVLDPTPWRPLRERGTP
jgi:hypothetical protein